MSLLLTPVPDFVALLLNSTYSEFKLWSNLSALHRPTALPHCCELVHIVVTVPKLAGVKSSRWIESYNVSMQIVESGVDDFSLLPFPMDFISFVLLPKPLWSLESLCC